MRHTTIASLALLLTHIATLQADDRSPLVKVITPQGEGTGAVIGILKNKPVADGFEGYVLTAYHVVADSATANQRDIKINYENGRRAKSCKVVASDIKADVAIVWAWVPAGIIPTRIAQQPAHHGDQLLFVGLGGGAKVTDESAIRRIEGKASAPTHGRSLYSDTVLIPGDSGGPVFNSEGQLVGTISGGWFWYHKEDLANLSSSNQRLTWPARASNVEPILALIKELAIDSPTPVANNIDN